MTVFVALLDLARGVFGAPSFAIFADLVTGWVCAPGRRTITGIVTVADPAGRRVHDAYHRFVRDGAWSMSLLWQGPVTCSTPGVRPDRGEVRWVRGRPAPARVA